MSSLWSAEYAAAATPRAPFAPPEAAGSFTPWTLDRARIERELAEMGPQFAQMVQPDAEPEPEPEPIDVEAIEQAAFAAGLAAGREEAGIAIAAERAELARLAEALQALRPEPTQALAAVLAETVDRLVRQIVGEVTIDPAALLHRATAAAALIGEETAPSVLRLAPGDCERLAGADLAVTISADASLASGTLVLETAQGWIEDGPAIRLDRLRVALDRIGAEA